MAWLNRQYLLWKIQLHSPPILAEARTFQTIVFLFLRIFKELLKPLIDATTRITYFARGSLYSDYRHTLMGVRNPLFFFPLVLESFYKFLMTSFKFLWVFFTVLPVFIHFFVLSFYFYFKIHDFLMGDIFTFVNIQ